MPLLNYVLIDYENVQPALGQLLDAETFRLRVFIGAAQTKVSTDTAIAMQRKGPAAQYVRMATNGRNALDFHIACTLGQLSVSDPKAYVHVISGDKDLDPLIAHLRAQGFKVGRLERVEDIPILANAAVPATPSTTAQAEPPAGGTGDDVVSVAIANLLSRGTSRPAQLKTLRNTLATAFQPRLSDTTVDGLLQQLTDAGIVTVTGQRIAYHLPD